MNEDKRATKRKIFVQTRVSQLDIFRVTTSTLVARVSVGHHASLAVYKAFPNDPLLRATYQVPALLYQHRGKGSYGGLEGGEMCQGGTGSPGVSGMQSRTVCVLVLIRSQHFRTFVVLPVLFSPVKFHAAFVAMASSGPWRAPADIPPAAVLTTHAQHRQKLYML